MRLGRQALAVALALGAGCDAAQDQRAAAHPADVLPGDSQVVVLWRGDQEAAMGDRLRKIVGLDRGAGDMPATLFRSSGALGLRFVDGQKVTIGVAERAENAVDADSKLRAVDGHVWLLPSGGEPPEGERLAERRWYRLARTALGPTPAGAFGFVCDPLAVGQRLMPAGQRSKLTELSGLRGLVAGAARVGPEREGGAIPIRGRLVLARRSSGVLRALDIAEGELALARVVRPFAVEAELFFVQRVDLEALRVAIEDSIGALLPNPAGPGGGLDLGMIFGHALLAGLGDEYAVVVDTVEADELPLVFVALDDSEKKRALLADYASGEKRVGLPLSFRKEGELFRVRWPGPAILVAIGEGFAAIGPTSAKERLSALAQAKSERGEGLPHPALGFGRLRWKRGPSLFWTLRRAGRELRLEGAVR